MRFMDIRNVWLCVIGNLCGTHRSEAIDCGAVHAEDTNRMASDLERQLSDRDDLDSKKLIASCISM